MPEDQERAEPGEAAPGDALVPVGPGDLRAAMGRMPTGVCVVSTVDDGHDVGLTVGSLVSVSLEPPLVLVCVGTQVRLHDALIRARTWGVSVLAAEALDVGAVFARRGGDVHGRFAQVDHHRGPVTGVPLVDRGCAWLECESVAVHPAGDHSVLLGRVVGTAVPTEVVPPLVHHAGGYAGVAPLG